MAIKVVLARKLDAAKVAVCFFEVADKIAGGGLVVGLVAQLGCKFFAYCVDCGGVLVGANSERRCKIIVSVAHCIFPSVVHSHRYASNTPLATLPFLFKSWVVLDIEGGNIRLMKVVVQKKVLAVDKLDAVLFCDRKLLQKTSKFVVAAKIFALWLDVWVKKICGYGKIWSKCLDYA